jgi:hypothetical protein
LYYFVTFGGRLVASQFIERVDKVELSGGEILVQCLIDEGVEYIFGYPGGAVLHIYDALFKQDKVKHILVRHEQGATHAADGLARATGKPGVVLVTSGPGATNAVTGIATAYLDSIPMVILSGQVPMAVIGSDAFQGGRRQPGKLADSVRPSQPVVDSKRGSIFFGSTVQLGGDKERRHAGARFAVGGLTRIHRKHRFYYATSGPFWLLVPGGSP